MKFIALILSAALAITSPSTMAGNITGAGSSTHRAVYLQWASEYEKATGHQVNYQTIGSAGGITKIKNGIVDFSVTDIPLSHTEMRNSGLTQLPVLISGVVPIVNINGVSPGDLKLTAPLIADIYLGKITQWSDERIRVLNPNIYLPNAEINIIYRSDASQTTLAFTTYLSQASDVWKNQVGVNRMMTGLNPSPATSLSSKGNEGVSSYVMRLKNSIGYLDYDAVKLYNATYTKLLNDSGKFVTPTDTTLATAINLKWADTEIFDDNTVTESFNTWPIATASFIVLPKQGGNKSQEVISFINWILNNGDTIAEYHGHSPLTKPTKIAMLTTLNQIE